MNRPSELGFIAMPGARSLAYLQTLRQRNYKPACVVRLKNPYAENATSFLQSHPLAAQYIDASLDEYSFCRSTDIPLYDTEFTSINDEGLLDLLLSTGIHTWLFSGGGIIKPALFDAGLRFLHIHPGQLPEVRGSTCFYYSLLHDNSLAATAFFMTAELDAGEPLMCRHFAINMAEPLLSCSFIDYVVDPWIRAQTLNSLLLQWSSFGAAIPAPTPPPPLISSPSDRPCYVMHPLLRALTIHKLSKRFDPKRPIGVHHFDRSN
ncbi:hypothetical protein ACFO3I_18035 [Rheinheimera marina]|uniref:Formyl transferase N-terminal domain-containing protein n=1 Tax=Rheinheimera marina TaxID=1774958 RepID=A0ABV9JS05_9GAMM